VTGITIRGEKDPKKWGSPKAGTLRLRGKGCIRMQLVEKLSTAKQVMQLRESSLHRIHRRDPIAP
jgi:hypothetical protein